MTVVSWCMVAVDRGEVGVDQQAAIGAGSEGEMPVVGVHDGLDDGPAEAETAGRAGAGGVAALEWP